MDLSFLKMRFEDVFIPLPVTATDAWTLDSAQHSSVLDI
jgi:hypothetical protein